jgi:hypothetical protein
MTRTRAVRLYYKAESALISAIEIYNKPDFAYREETFAILAINAWELLLKAKVLTDNANDPRALYVFEHRTNADGTRSKKKYLRRNRAGNVHTVGMGPAIALLEANPSTRLPPEVRGNLEALVEVRDNAVHFVNAGFELAKHVLEVGTACVRNFIALAGKWFNQDLSRYSLYLMPIGFLSAPAATALAVGGKEGKLVSYLRNLVAAQNTSTTSTSGYHIALDINLSFKRSATDAISTFTLTSDPSAPHVYLTEEDIRSRYPWDYKELVKRCRATYSDFKENEAFHSIRRPLLEDKRFVSARFLDPGNPKSSKKAFHSPNILRELDKHYTRKR